MQEMSEANSDKPWNTHEDLNSSWQRMTTHKLNQRRRCNSPKYTALIENQCNESTWLHWTLQGSGSTIKARGQPISISKVNAVYTVYMSMCKATATWRDQHSMNCSYRLIIIMEACLAKSQLPIQLKCTPHKFTKNCLLWAAVNWTGQDASLPASRSRSEYPEPFAAGWGLRDVCATGHPRRVKCAMPLPCFEKCCSAFQCWTVLPQNYRCFVDVSCWKLQGFRIHQQLN